MTAKIKREAMSDSSFQISFGARIMAKTKKMLGDEKVRCVLFLVFKVFYIGGAFAYFLYNPGEKRLILGIFGYLIVLPAGIISITVFCAFYRLEKIRLTGIPVAKLLAMAIGDGFLIFPLIPVTVYLAVDKMVGPGNVWFGPFVLLLYPAIFFCYVWYYRLASRFLDKQRL